MPVVSIPQLTCLHILEDHSGVINSAAISPDNRYLAAGGGPDPNRPQRRAPRWSLTVWDLLNQTHHLLPSNYDNGNYPPHNNPINAITFSHNGSFLNVGSADHTSQTNTTPCLSVWALDPLSLHATYNPPDIGVSMMASHPTLPILAVKQGNGKVRLLHQAETGDLIPETEWDDQYGFVIQFSANGQRLYTQGKDHDIQIWEVETGIDLDLLCGHHQALRTLAVSPDDSTLVSGSDQRIKIWDCDTGILKHSFFGHPDWIRGLVITADGKYLLSTGDSKIKIWDLQTGEKLQTIQAHDSPIRSMVLSHDASLLVTGSTDGVLKVWQLQS